MISFRQGTLALAAALSFFALVAPAAAEQIPSLCSEERNQAEMNRDLNTLTDIYGSQGHEIGGLNPDEYATFLRAETEKWARVAQKAGIPKQ